MGVKISDIIPKQEIEIKSLFGKILAVDTHNILYQFLSIIRQPDGTPLMDSKGNVTSHLSGIFYRNIHLIDSGIKLVYVFDGKRPEFKEATAVKRKEAKEKAKEKWDEAKEKGDMEEARKYAQATAELTGDMVKESKELLNAMGIPVIQAPSEGEAQCAYLCKKGDVWAVSSSDYDSLLFGASKLIRNLSITGRRKVPGKTIYREIKPEIIYLKKVLDSLKITREQLITIGILIGTDYNIGGVKGIGPKNALKLVKEHKTFDKIIQHVNWDFDVSAKGIYDFFMNPPISKDYSLKAGIIDENKIKKILVDRHEFSEERIQNALHKLNEIEERKKQTSLGKWG